MARILIVAAHPDDEILGCGATILNRIAQGDEIYSLVLGEGITSRYAERAQAEDSKMQELHQANRRVADFMGLSGHYLLDFPDNRFDSVDLLDIVKEVEKIKREVMPDIIFTHFEGDLNVDHRITFQAVLTACRPIADENVKEILSFEIPSSTEWISPFNGSGTFRPNYFIDVSETIELKIKAMKFYESEIKSFPHPRSEEALRIIAQYWGIVSGMAFAEAFMLVRKIG